MIISKQMNVTKIVQFYTYKKCMDTHKRSVKFEQQRVK